MNERRMTVSIREGGTFVMTETRLSHRRRSAPLRVALATAVLVVLTAVLAALPLAAQESTDSLSDTTSTCLSPSTQQWVIIGVGTLAIFIFCFFLLVRLVQRSFIRRDRNASLGRHVGISLTFLVSSLGMTALAYLITGCLNHQFVLWLCFPLALWVIHGIYTLIVVRGE
jgi:hypothetical protein